jgi:hypothetical protein
VKEESLDGFRLELEDCNRDFADKLNKDFSCEVACKIKLISVLLTAMQAEED